MFLRRRVDRPDRTTCRVAPALSAFILALVIALTSQTVVAHDDSRPQHFNEGGKTSEGGETGRDDVELEEPSRCCTSIC